MNYKMSKNFNNQFRSDILNNTNNMNNNNAGTMNNLGNMNNLGDMNNLQDFSNVMNLEDINNLGDMGNILNQNNTGNLNNMNNLGTVNGINSGMTNGVAPEDETMSYVRIIHAAPGVPAVDIYLDDELVVENLNFSEDTEFLPIPGGSYNIKVYATGTVEEPFIDTDVEIPEGTRLTIAAIGTTDNLTLLPIPEDIIGGPIQESRIRVVHLSPDAPAIDVTLENGKVVFQNVEYGEITDYVDVPRGLYTFLIRPTGTSTAVMRIPNVQIMPNFYYTIYVIGELEGEPGLQVFASVNRTPGVLSPEFDEEYYPLEYELTVTTPSTTGATGTPSTTNAPSTSTTTTTGTTSTPSTTSAPSSTGTTGATGATGTKGVTTGTTTTNTTRNLSNVDMAMEDFSRKNGNIHNELEKFGLDRRITNYLIRMMFDYINKNHDKYRGTTRRRANMAARDLNLLCPWMFDIFSSLNIPPRKTVDITITITTYGFDNL